MKALNITSLHTPGEITSLVFNPHDECFYGCNAISHTIVQIKGIYFIYLFCFALSVLLVLILSNIVFLKKERSAFGIKDLKRI